MVLQFLNVYLQLKSSSAWRYAHSDFHYAHQLKSHWFTPSSKAIGRYNYSISDNFYLVSSLPFLGMVIEKMVMEQVQRIKDEMDYVELYQSGFKPGYDIETTLAALLDYLRHEQDRSCASILRCWVWNGEQHASAQPSKIECFVFWKLPAR